MIKIKKFLLFVLFAVFLFISCSSAQTNNSKQGSDSDLKSQLSKQIKSRNGIKSKALESAKSIHKLLNERQFNEVYQIIDDNSSLKLPKSEFLKEIQNFINKFGKLEEMELNAERVTMNNEVYEIKQEFTVKFENDPPAVERNEIFVWKVYPNNDLKLLIYSNEVEK